MKRLPGGRVEFTEADLRRLALPPDFRRSSELLRESGEALQKSGRSMQRMGWVLMALSIALFAIVLVSIFGRRMS